VDAMTMAQLRGVDFPPKSGQGSITGTQGSASANPARRRRQP
jgi:hypothetical protein